ncbi:hypothetical protein F3X89_21910 [Rhizobium rhizogenes]|uniref:hypothetical protein n=1 Tax=Rhizobium rhizogenes TaxID=359 RepID=UPI00193D7424|nr:hypothetical protein [Rhizobium rhizogenes]QRM40481.1 hypothetical protein F3X89_21910 [Rhizobium rhizogenes]
MADNNGIEEHGLIEQVWIAIGPQGMVAAAVATVAIGSTTGWINALWSVVAGFGGAIVWLLVMKLLIKDRPAGYRAGSSRR